LPAELENCSVFLDEELVKLHNLRVVIVLGKIAFDAYLRALRRNGAELPKPLPVFAHNAAHRLGEGMPVLVSSYHPSRQNTNTGKLTEPMLDAVFQQARRLLS
jgi:uracil-DNA glycosylase